MKGNYGSFSHDVLAAILVGQNKQTVAMLVDQNNPRGIEFYLYANNSFCSMAAGHLSENHLSKSACT